MNQIANFTQRPQDVVGLHFFSPANVTRLLEIVRGAKTAKDVIATSFEHCEADQEDRRRRRRLRRLHRQPHAERVFSDRWICLLDVGALPQQIDKALENFGFAMGPFRVGDLAGNDIGWSIRKRLYVEYPDRYFSRIPDRICELGRFGQKTGAGWYDYKPGDRNAAFRRNWSRRSSWKNRRAWA